MVFRQRGVSPGAGAAIRLCAGKKKPARGLSEYREPLNPNSVLGES